MQQGLLSAFNPSDALPAPRYTGMLLPIERDMYGTKGNFELAVPQFLQDAYSGINKFGQAFRGELSPEQLQQLAFDTSMNVTGGSLLGSRVIPNAVPSGGILGMGVSNTPKQTGLLGKKQSPSDLRKQANIERFGYDPNEVVDTSYRMQHTPNPDGARLDDMTKGGEVFPDDIYSSNGLLYYGNPKSLADRQSFEVIQKVKGNPDAEVTIYRAVPNQDNITTINSGDFVTLSEDYAKLHGQSGYGVDGSEAGKILSKKVKVRDLFSEGNDLNEFGYFPSKETTSQTGLLGKVDNVQPKSGVSEVVPPTDKADGIFAFHGSGQDFDKFKLSKIGTGEGNQAFGYGLYFTESEDIAKFYKNAMSQKGTEGLTKTVDYKGKKINIDNIETNEESFVYANANLNPEITKNKLFKEKKRIEKEIATNNQAISQIQSGKVYKSFDGTEISEIEFEKNNKFFQPKLDAINKVIDNLSEIKIVDSAKTYEVKINAVMDDLIDYDKSLGQQSDNIKNILNKMKSEVTVDDAVNLGFDPFDFAGSQKKAIQETIKSLFGKDEDVVRFLNNWSAIRGEQATGEKLLAKYGAKGIKYKADQGVGARNVPETGKNNYVIFDDKIIDIMKKYGIVGAVGVTAMQGGEQSPEANLSL